MFYIIIEDFPKKNVLLLKTAFFLIVYFINLFIYLIAKQVQFSGYQSGNANGIHKALYKRKGRG